MCMHEGFCKGSWISKVRCSYLLQVHHYQGPISAVIAPRCCYCYTVIGALLASNGSGNASSHQAHGHANRLSSFPLSYVSVLILQR